MTEQDKATKPKPALKEVVAESTEKLEQVAKEATEQVTEAVVESKEKLEAEAKQLNASVQEHLRQFKQDLLLRLETIKGQLSNSQKDLTELKEFVKTEFTAVLDDLTKLGKELKGDVSEISVKHKDQLTETFKRSKEHTLDAWNKVSSK